MICGWLFDVYPLNDKIILWIKNKNIHRLEIKWTPSIYVASDNRYKLEKLRKNQQVLSLITKYKWVNKIEKVSRVKHISVKSEGNYQVATESNWKEIIEKSLITYNIKTKEILSKEIELAQQDN